jgi:hypothetical protein
LAGTQNGLEKVASSERRPGQQNYYSQSLGRRIRLLKVAKWFVNWCSAYISDNCESNAHFLIPKSEERSFFAVGCSDVDNADQVGTSYSTALRCDQGTDAQGQDQGQNIGL